MRQQKVAFVKAVDAPCEQPSPTFSPLCSITVADYGPKCSQFHEVFRKIWQNHMLAPPTLRRVGTPSYGESWIRPCIIMVIEVIKQWSPLHEPTPIGCRLLFIGLIFYCYQSLLFRNSKAHSSRSKYHVGPNWIIRPLFFITARKRSLRRLCFYMCLSFCQQGACLSACWIPPLGTRHPPGADTPWDQVPPQYQAPPWEQTPPRADTPSEQTPPAGPGNPQTRHPPGAGPPEPVTQPRSRHTPIQCMLGDMANKRAVCILLECNLVKKLNLARPCRF